MLRRSILALLAGMLMTGLSTLSMAQEGGAKPAEGAKPEAKPAKAPRMTKIERALSTLTLTDEQKAKIDPILAEYANKRKAAGKDISAQKKLMDETCAQITPLLTEEQKAKFEEAMKARPGARKEKPAEKKEGEAHK